MCEILGTGMLADKVCNVSDKLYVSGCRRVFKGSSRKLRVQPIKKGRCALRSLNSKVHSGAYRRGDGLGLNRVVSLWGLRPVAIIK